MSEVKIIDVLNKHGHNSPYKKLKGDYGLEIETETINPYDVPKFSFWSAHVDRSLRNFGMEYVLKTPLSLEKEIPEALDEFSTKLKGVNFIKDSITTSLHVHVNVLNMSFRELGNYFVAYTLAENLLVRFSGESRKSNLFALPICDAEGTYHNMIHLLRSVESLNFNRLYFDPEAVKYAALNLASLDRFGSLEIRSFRGTTDVKEILSWVEILDKIKVFATAENRTPVDIVESYRARGPNIVRDIFGDKYALIRHDAEEQLIDKNFWYASSIAHSLKSWENLGEVPQVKAKANLDELAIKLFGRAFNDLLAEMQETVLKMAGEESSLKKKKQKFGQRADEPAHPAFAPRAAPVFEQLRIRDEDVIEDNDWERMQREEADDIAAEVEIVNAGAAARRRDDVFNEALRNAVGRANAGREQGE